MTFKNKNSKISRFVPGTIPEIINHHGSVQGTISHYLKTF